MVRGWTVVVVLVVLAAGCGRSDPVSVRGRVTLDGQPVGPGSIAFLPEPGTDGRKAAAPVEDGGYAIPAGRGPAPGTFKVEINWAKKTGRRVPSADPGVLIDETREGMPPQFNSRTTLTVEIGPGENVRDFDLKSR